MRARPSGANILAAGLVAAAFGLLLLVAFAFFSAPARNGAGDLTVASQPLRGAGDDVEAAGAVALPPPPASRADAGAGEPGSDRQLVAGDGRAAVMRDELAATREPLEFAASSSSLESAPLVLEPPVFDPIEDPEVPDPPWVRDAGSVAPEELDAGAVQAPPQPSAAPAQSPIAGQGGAALTPNGVVEREACGTALCPQGWVCCNESCGTCTEPGQSCSQLRCSMPAYPVSVACGRNTCAIGEVCCNWSCGICAAPGASCSQRVCD